MITHLSHLWRKCFTSFCNSTINLDRLVIAAWLWDKMSQHHSTLIQRLQLYDESIIHTTLAGHFIAFALHHADVSAGLPQSVMTTAWVKTLSNEVRGSIAPLHCYRRRQHPAVPAVFDLTPWQCVLCIIDDCSNLCVTAFSYEMKQVNRQCIVCVWGGQAAGVPTSATHSQSQCIEYLAAHPDTHHDTVSRFNVCQSRSSVG